MSFVLPPGEPIGNNANARTVSLAVMNQREPTPGQLAEAEAVFNEHMAAGRYSLAGYRVEERTLSDGSEIRIVSNGGQHAIQLWPAGAGSMMEIERLFWAVPANATSTHGTETPPVGFGFVKDKATNLPATLKQTHELWTAADQTHPGHLAWSSPEFTLLDEQVVVTIRGPRDRYAAVVNPGAVAVYPAPADIDEELFRDHRLVGINGIVRQVPYLVFGACLHRPDPLLPNEIVLRVLTHDTAGGYASARGTVDLVPTGATKGVSLSALIRATSFAALATKAMPSSVQFATRPHFNSKGDRVAGVCTRTMTDSDGTARTGRTVRVFDPSDWIEVQEVLAPYSLTSTETYNVTETGGGPPYTSYPNSTAVDTVLTTASQGRHFIAADFLDDVVAWVATEHEWEATRTIHSEMGQATSSTDSRTETETRTGLGTMTHKLVHSHHGDLFSDTWVYNDSGQFDSDSSASSGSGTHGVMHNDTYSFVGDLSRDVLAIGVQVFDNMPEAAVACPLFYSLFNDASGTHVLPGNTVGYYGKVAVTLTSTRLKWDVWAGGLRRAEAVTGAFTNNAPVGVAAEHKQIVTYNVASNHRAGVPWAAASSSSLTFDGGDLGPINPFQMAFIRTLQRASSPQYTHAAATVDRKLAYLGIAHTDYGLELVLSKDAEGVYATANPPNYAGGTRPTASAPVFTGYLVRPNPQQG